MACLIKLKDTCRWIYCQNWRIPTVSKRGLILLGKNINSAQHVLSAQTDHDQNILLLTIYWPTLKRNEVNSKVKYENYICNKNIQQPIKMHVLYMALHQFRQCWRGSKLGQGCVPGNHLWDYIDWFKKKPIIFILHLTIHFIVFFGVGQYVMV